MACLGYTANVDLSLSDSKPVFLITAHVQFLLVVQRGLHPRLRVCFGQSKFQALFYLYLLLVFLAMALSALSALPRPLVPIPACGQRPCGYRMRNPIWLLPTSCCYLGMWSLSCCCGWVHPQVNPVLWDLAGCVCLTAGRTSFPSSAPCRAAQLLQTVPISRFDSFQT